jgi:hypothetical protein
MTIRVKLYFQEYSLLSVLGAVNFKLHNLTRDVEIYAIGDNHIKDFVKKFWLST